MLKYQMGILSETEVVSSGRKLLNPESDGQRRQIYQVLEAQQEQVSSQRSSSTQEADRLGMYERAPSTRLGFASRWWREIIWQIRIIYIVYKYH